MSYLVVAYLRNPDMRDMANNMTKQYYPEIENGIYRIHVQNMHEAYKIQDQLRSRDRYYKFRDQVWRMVSVQLGKENE
jgi:hypothetical protein